MSGALRGPRVSSRSTSCLSSAYTVHSASPMLLVSSTPWCLGVCEALWQIQAAFLGNWKAESSHSIPWGMGGLVSVPGAAGGDVETLQGSHSVPLDVHLAVVSAVSTDFRHGP